MNRTSLTRTLVVVVGIVIIAAIVILTHGGDAIPKQYSEKNLGISFTYPGNMELVEQASTGGDSGAQPLILRLFAKEGNILIVPSLMTNDKVEAEKSFYEGMLFAEANQQNSRVELPNYTGFKSAISFENLLYTVYRPKTASTTLILRTEITASSSAALANLETTLLDIFQSIVLN